MVVTGAGMEADDGSGTGNIENMWCDVETQRFYRDLPELQAFLPTSFINKSQTPPPAEPVTEEALESEIPAEDLEEDGKYVFFYTKLHLVFSMLFCSPFHFSEK